MDVETSGGKVFRIFDSSIIEIFKFTCFRERSHIELNKKYFVKISCNNLLIKSKTFSSNFFFSKLHPGQPEGSVM